VKQALTLKDDTKVQLKGYVVKAVGDEKYQFRDNTGTITVDIDDELWHGKPISAKTPVTLIGEVDIDYKPAKRVEIDVEAVKF
ncbi:MAG: NirD/YgiW/YdeI family stress tolerance protein, partial [Acinetobacter bohemicus]